jgi:hypothetical protein
MTTRTPIATADIRKGDTVRFEWDLSEVTGNATAIEYVAEHDGQYWSTIGEHYRLDPTPAPLLTLDTARTMAEWGDEPVKCCVCGGEATHVGLVLLTLSGQPERLAAVAWCNRKQECIDDAVGCVAAGTAIVRPVES